MRILFVDAGNYCRSPAAEAVARALAARAGAGGRLEFSSAGLKDKHVGDTADPRNIEACRARGYDLGGFRCREITPQDFATSDLILAMDRENLAQLRKMFSRIGKGFCLAASWRQTKRLLSVSVVKKLFYRLVSVGLGMDPEFLDAVGYDSLRRLEHPRRFGHVPPRIFEGVDDELPFKTSHRFLERE